MGRLPPCHALVAWAAPAALGVAEQSTLGCGLPTETGAAWLQASGTYGQHRHYAAEPHCSLPTQPYSSPKLPLVLPALGKHTPSQARAADTLQAASHKGSGLHQRLMGLYSRMFPNHFLLFSRARCKNQHNTLSAIALWDLPGQVTLEIKILILYLCPA